MRVTPGCSGEAQEIRHCVLFPFDVLACQAVGAGDDESRQFSRNQLHRFVTQRVGAQFAGFVEPADGGGIVAEGQHAILFTAESGALEYD
jgi:hypothetical protein